VQPMTHGKKRFVHFALFALGWAGWPVAFLLFLGVGRHQHGEIHPAFVSDPTKVVEGSHIGRTFEQIVSELGQPNCFDTYPYGNPPADYLAKFKEMRTLRYFYPAGRFLASISLVDGQWICFSSHWMPKGTEF